jgi:hypothetical protein
MDLIKLSWLSGYSCLPHFCITTSWLSSCHGFRLAVFLISLLPHAWLSSCQDLGQAVFLPLLSVITQWILSSWHGFQARCLPHSFIITSWISSSWHSFQASCLPRSYIIIALIQAVFLSHHVLAKAVTCRDSCLAHPVLTCLL